VWFVGAFTTDGQNVRALKFSAAVVAVRQEKEKCQLLTTPERRQIIAVLTQRNGYSVSGVCLGQYDKMANVGRLAVQKFDRTK